MKKRVKDLSYFFFISSLCGLKVISVITPSNCTISSTCLAILSGFKCAFLLFEGSKLNSSKKFVFVRSGFIFVTLTSERLNSSKRAREKFLSPAFVAV